MPRPIHALFLALAALFVSAPTLAAPQEDLPDLKGSIDGSIRWLRSVQNPEDGSYGGGVAGTAWVLHAMHVSPRSYVRADGPFVSKAIDYLVAAQKDDGAIHDAGADGAQEVRQTNLAAVALSGLVDEATAPALGDAVVWLAENGVDQPQLDGIEVPEDDAEARALVVRILSQRGEDGAYDGPQGKVIETARACEALTRLKKKLTPADSGARASAMALPGYETASPEDIDAAILRGARFLVNAGEGGRWGAPGQPDAGLTAMVTGALQEVPEPRPKDIQAAIDSAAEWLLTLQGEDGSISQGRLKNYVTSAAIMVLVRREGTDEAVQRARGFLKTIQSDEGEGYSEGDLYYGGIGYGGDERPDLSNLQMALDALVASGSGKDDPEIQRALKFLERCQNRSESNDVAVTRDGIVIKSGDDGGAGYMPGDSKAGFVTLEDGTQVPRSYGSMSYALLKGLVFAGLEKDDPRVEACWKWLTENYTLDVNPGFLTVNDPRAPYQGLFYYFDTMAKALDVYGVDTIETPDGESHDWRAELGGRLVSMQSKTDGSWVNRNAPRWWEGNPVLATAYALQALGAARE